MKVQSISVVPCKQGCNARCRYCIAAMTKTPNKGERIDFKKFVNALYYAKAGNAQTGILTSKGETLLTDWMYLGYILMHFKSYGKLGQRDLNTNAFNIVNRYDEFNKTLVAPSYGLTNITITVPALSQGLCKHLMGKALDFKKVFKELKDMGLMIRLSCGMNKQGVYSYPTMEKYINQAVKLGVDAIVFRELWIPKHRNKNKVTNWCVKNRTSRRNARFFLKEMYQRGFAEPFLKLPWGEVAYDIGGTGLQVVTATCNVNKNDTSYQYKEGFKSIIYLPDNHLYTSWGSKASKIM